MRYTKLGRDYPNNRETGWSDQLNGVTHDDGNWFFTQRKTLWKFPVTHDLNKKVTRADPSQGILRTGIPESLAGQGYDHFGDLDHYGGFLFVPLEKPSPKRPRIAVFRARDLAYVGASAPLQDQADAPWCAINPKDGLLYSSNFNRHGHPLVIYKYKPDSHNLADNFVVHLESVKGVFRIFDESHTHLALACLQGAAFSPDGYLYLLNGYYKDFNPRKGGISVFRCNSEAGLRVAKSRSGSGDFNYEFHPGWSKYEEPEGITYWDLDEDQRAPNIRGQLHAIMLDTDHVFGATDDLYFKHYREDKSRRIQIRCNTSGGFGSFMYAPDNGNDITMPYPQAAYNDPQTHFELIRLEDDKIALRAHNGKYVRAKDGGGGKLAADRDHIRSHETFRVIYRSGTGNLVAFQANNGRYLRATREYKALADSQRIDSWAEFRLIDL